MAQDFVTVTQKMFFFHIVLVKHILFHCVCVVCVCIYACLHALAYYRGSKKSLPQLAFSMWILYLCHLCASTNFLVACSFHMQAFLSFGTVLCVSSLKGSRGGKFKLVILHPTLILSLKCAYMVSLNFLSFVSCPVPLISSPPSLRFAPKSCFKFPLGLDSQWLITSLCVKGILCL